MTVIKRKLEQLKDQIWEVAKQCLDTGETKIYRSLTDMAEKMTILVDGINTRDETDEDTELLDIFTTYKGEKYTARLAKHRIDGSSGYCVLYKGHWWTASGSAHDITGTSVNGWRHFWKYIDSGIIKPIEEIKKSKILKF